MVRSCLVSCRVVANFLTTSCDFMLLSILLSLCCSILFSLACRLATEQVRSFASASVVAWASLHAFSSFDRASYSLFILAIVVSRSFDKASYSPFILAIVVSRSSMALFRLACWLWRDSIISFRCFTRSASLAAAAASLSVSSVSSVLNLRASASALSISSFNVTQRPSPSWSASSCCSIMFCTRFFSSLVSARVVCNFSASAFRLSAVSACFCTFLAILSNSTAWSSASKDCFLSNSWPTRSKVDSASASKARILSACVFFKCDSCFWCSLARSR